MVSSITSGTVTGINFRTEYSFDGGTTWYGRGLFIESNPGPIWINGVTNPTFSGSGSVPPGATNFRIRPVTLTGSSPVLSITISVSQSSGGIYVYNLPTAAAGTTSVAAVNVQGEASGIPLDTNTKQQAGLTLAAPTAPGTPATTGLVPTVNFAGTVTATISGFTPNGNTLASPSEHRFVGERGCAAARGGYCSVLKSNRVKC